MTWTVRIPIVGYLELNGLPASTEAEAIQRANKNIEARNYSEDDIYWEFLGSKRLESVPLQIEAEEEDDC